MASMSIGNACNDGATAVQSFAAPVSASATTGDATEGAGALATDTEFVDDVAPTAALQGGGGRLAELLAAARDQMSVSGADRLGQLRMSTTGDDTPFGRQLGHFLDKLDRFRGTIDDQELAAIEELVKTARQDGGFSPSALARVMIQVEGSASGLPSEYLEAADQAQELAAQMEREIEQMTGQLLELVAGTQGYDQQTMHVLDQLQGYADGLQLLQEQLRANFERALQDPDGALASLRQGMQSMGAAAA